MVIKNRSRRLFLLLTGLIAFHFSVAQVGSTCANPDLIPSLPFSSGNKSTCTSADNYTSKMACGNAYMNGYDYVYKFQPTSVLDACINLSFGGAAASKGIFVFDGCPDLNSTNCIAQGIDKTAPASIQGLQLTVGKTYYIIVSSQYGCASFTLNVTNAGTCSAPPAGSTCANATLITALPYTTSAKTCLQGDHFNAGNACNSAFMNGEDYVFKFTPTSYQCISLNLSGITGSTGLFVINGCPDNPKSRCVGSAVASSGSTVTLPYVALNANQTYYIVVSTNAPTTPCTNFTININNVSCGPLGSYCGNPYVIPSLPFNHPNQTTCGYKQNYTNGMGCPSNYMGGEDFVYTYTPSATECVIMSLSNVGTWGSGIYVMSGCADDASTTCVAKAEAGSPSNPPSLTVTLSAGTKYFIYVAEGWGCTSFSFNMTSKPVGLAGSTCANAYTIGTLPFNVTGFTTGCFGNDYTSADACKSTHMNGEDFVFKYTCTSTKNVRIVLSNTNAAAGLFVLNGPPNAGGTCLQQQYAGTEGSPAICNVSLDPGTYYIIVDTDPSGFSGATFTPFDFSMEVVPPGTDCTDPYVINALPFSQSGFSTRCFRKDYTPSDACKSSSMNAEDFVFRFTSSTNDCIKIKLSDLETYVGLFLVKGCPNTAGAVCMGQAVCYWSCSTLNITSNITPGTYYIIVSGSWEPTSFDISVQSATAAAPVADFSSGGNVICIGEQVNFVDQSSPCVTSWSWKFPGGTPSTSTLQFPTVTYNSSGRYSVTLTSSNAGGSNTVTKTNYIKVK